MKRHERKGPALVTPGRNAMLVKIRAHTEYSEADDIATAAIAEAAADLPDFETGWLWYHEHGDARPHPVAFLRPWHGDWYDLHHFDNWVDAVSRALALTKTRANCLYVGGPSE